MQQTPILIPVKHYSLRCPGKNKTLLPYITEFLRKENRLQDAVVISDSLPMLDEARSLSLKTHFETREEWQDELVSCWNYMNSINCERFFLCPVTQPFKSAALFEKMENELAGNKLQTDFICTATNVPNREIFYLQDKETDFWKFQQTASNRKGALCPEQLMIDGALYLIRTSFLEKVISSADPNASWWGGNFKCVVNDAPFMDIDTPQDMQKFNFLRAYFS